MHLVHLCGGVAVRHGPRRSMYTNLDSRAFQSLGPSPEKLRKKRDVIYLSPYSDEGTPPS